MNQVLKSLKTFSNLRLVHPTLTHESLKKQLLSTFVVCNKCFLSPKLSPNFQQLCLLRSVVHQGKKNSPQIQNEVYSTQPLLGTVVDSSIDTDKEISHEVIDCVNKQISSRTHGRLFAIIHIAGKQFKITTEDMIVIHANMPAKIGEKIILEKILLVGSKDFTLIGHPLLSKEMIRIDATVIEKTLSQVMTYFKMKPREQFRRLRFLRNPYTVLRINNISFEGLLDKKPPVEGIRGKIF